MSQVVHGTCLCGGVAYDVHDPRMMAVCHCTRCQRWTGGAGNPIVIVAANDFAVTKGQDLVRQYHEDGFGDRHFCSNCGSSVYVSGGETYYVSAGGRRDVTLQHAFHMQVATKPPWHEIGGSAPQFPEWPPQ